MIDEIQRVPELLLAIKREVDRDARPGRFLLTGSARLLRLKDLPDALPGRAETIELWPLSQGEIDSGSSVRDSRPTSTRFCSALPLASPFRASTRQSTNFSLEEMFDAMRKPA
jgi:predicted AAA+ superfamily ATPase